VSSAINIGLKSKDVSRDSQQAECITADNEKADNVYLAGLFDGGQRQPVRAHQLVPQHAFVPQLHHQPDVDTSRLTVQTHASTLMLRHVVVSNTIYQDTPAGITTSLQSHQYQLPSSGVARLSCSAVTWESSVVSAQGLKLETRSAESGDGALERACYRAWGAM